MQSQSATYSMHELPYTVTMSMHGLGVWPVPIAWRAIAVGLRLLQCKYICKS